METTAEFCNWTIILLTCGASWLVFRSPEVEEKYIFEPERILARKEYYRLVTSAFLHSDWQHLLVNMLSLYLFGGLVELFVGHADFLLLYFGAIIGGGLLSLFVHRHHEYRAYGASGGVCGILFANLLLFPGARISPFFLPLAIPGWLYACGFMLYSFYGLKNNRDNIGHDAHLGGAVVGLLIAAGLFPQAVRYNWKLFALVLGVALVLLGYLWFNPLFLPLNHFRTKRAKAGPPAANLPAHKQESLQVDAILEKIAQNGMESLTPQDKELLTRVSAKYQRRSESKKPESDLMI